MTSLAMMHIAGKEDEEAARWFRRGAEVGDLAAQHDYALLLLQGRGVIKDEQAATRWYSAAAAQGGKSCYLPLAELYASGTGVARDPVEAYALAVIAEAILDDSDMFGVRLAELKAALGKELSPTQMKVARSRAQAMRPDLRRGIVAKELLPSLCANRAVGSPVASVWDDCDNRGLSERPAATWSSVLLAEGRPNVRRSENQGRRARSRMTWPPTR